MRNFHYQTLKESIVFYLYVVLPKMSSGTLKNELSDCSSYTTVHVFIEEAFHVDTDEREFLFVYFLLFFLPKTL